MAFKLNVWISGWSTKKDTLSQQVLSEIVALLERDPMVKRSKYCQGLLFSVLSHIAKHVVESTTSLFLKDKVIF